MLVSQDVRGRYRCEGKTGRSKPISKTAKVASNTLYFDAQRHSAIILPVVTEAL